MKIKIGILTSSRADYGIYKPLLEKLSKDNRFNLIIIAFGMHLQKHHGFTINEIRRDNFGTIHTVLGMPNKDSPTEISKGYGELIVNFSEYWSLHNFDHVFALGDRFEMSAAVQAGIPFEVNYSHIHGGETTLGAIDNIYRHQITLASKNHFVAANCFADKVENIIGARKNIYCVGALSLDGIKKIKLPDWNAVRLDYGIPDVKFILVTIHSQTINIEENEKNSQIFFDALTILANKTHLVITLSNADTMGKLFRDMTHKLKSKYPEKISIIHSFGKENYFAAMKASEMLLGNSSSGILEAASFNKYVINVGNRQGGRMRSNNVIDVPFNINMIIEKVKKIEANNIFIGKNKYYKEKTAEKIIGSLMRKQF